MRKLKGIKYRKLLRVDIKLGYIGGMIRFRTKMGNLNFEWIPEQAEYRIYNNKEEHVGNVSLEKIGRWSHWSLKISKYLMKKMIGCDEYLIFSPGCQDEVRQFCKELNSNRRKARVR